MVPCAWAPPAKASAPHSAAARMVLIMEWGSCSKRWRGTSATAGEGDRDSIVNGRVVASRGGDIARLHAGDAGLGHLRPGRLQRAVQIDAARRVLDHGGLEAGLAR